MLALYILISFLNVFLHTTKNIIIIKYPNKLVGSLANCVCYTFSAIVVKFIAETDLWIAICVQAGTNFSACYLAMWVCELMLESRKVTSKSNDHEKV